MYSSGITAQCVRPQSAPTPQLAAVHHARGVAVPSWQRLAALKQPSSPTPSARNAGLVQVCSAPSEAKRPAHNAVGRSRKCESGPNHALQPTVLPPLRVVKPARLNAGVGRKGKTIHWRFHELNNFSRLDSDPEGAICEAPPAPQGHFLGEGASQGRSKSCRTSGTWRDGAFRR